MSEVLERLNRTIEAQGPDSLLVQARDALSAAYDTIARLHENDRPLVAKIESEFRLALIEFCLDELGVTDEYLPPDIADCGCEAEQGTMHLVWHLAQRARSTADSGEGDDS